MNMQDYQTLLDISQTIAETDNMLDLLRQIDVLLKPIFGHADAGVLVADRDRHFVTDYHARYHEQIPVDDRARRLNQTAAALGFDRMPLPGSLIEWSLTQPPMHGALADLPQRGFDAPFLEYELREGLTHYFNAPFTVSGDTFGLCVLLFDAPPDPALLPLFAQVAKIIAPALSSILARDELREREREKTLLLSLSEDVATIRHAEDLLRVVYSKVKQIFPFADAGLFVVDEAGEYHRDLFIDYNLFDDTLFAFASLPTGWLPHKDSGIEQLMREEQPFVVTLDQLIERFPGHVHYPPMREAGIQQSIGTRLVSGERVLGLFLFNSLEAGTYSNKDFPLFQSICSQLSTAVANILANEEVAALAEERRQRAEELERTNRAVERSLRRLASEAAPDAFIAGLHHELCELLGGECSAQFRLDWDTQRVNRGVVVVKGKLARSDDVAQMLDMGFEEVPVSPGRLEEDCILRFNLGRDRALMNDLTLSFMEQHGCTWLINLPLFVRERPTWVVAVLGRDEARLSERNLNLFRQLARQLTLALELKQLGDEARREAEAAATLQERNRIARDIHDTLAQGFTGVIVQLGTAQRLLDSDIDARVAGCIERSIALARESLAEARRSVAALRPLPDDQPIDLSRVLRDNLERMTADTDIVNRITISGTPQALSPDTTTNLLRISQEALTNALRHAGASEIAIDVAYDQTGVYVRISDDGRGFEPGATNAGFGLASMRERARQLNATFAIASRPDGGTTISVHAKA